MNLLPNCTDILVDVRNPVYASIDGVLFTKNLSTMIDYPKGKTDAEYVVPKTLKEIGYDAFTNPYLETVKFEDCIESIGPYAFHSSNNVKKLLLPLGCPNPVFDSSSFQGMQITLKNFGHYVPHVCRFYPISCEINPLFHALIFSFPIHVFILL